MRGNWSTLVLVVLAVAVGALRVFGYKSVAFQALAHVYVGGLFGAGLCGRRDAFELAVALAILEVVCFLAG